MDAQTQSVSLPSKDLFKSFFSITRGLRTNYLYTFSNYAFLKDMTSDKERQFELDRLTKKFGLQAITWQEYDDKMAKHEKREKEIDDFERDFKENLKKEEVLKKKVREEELLKVNGNMDIDFLSSFKMEDDKSLEVNKHPVTSKAMFKNVLIDKSSLHQFKVNGKSLSAPLFKIEKDIEKGCKGNIRRSVYWLKEKHLQYLGRPSRSMMTVKSMKLFGKKDDNNDISSDIKFLPTTFGILKNNVPTKKTISGLLNNLKHKYGDYKDKTPRFGTRSFISFYEDGKDTPCKWLKGEIMKISRYKMTDESKLIQLRTIKCYVTCNPRVIYNAQIVYHQNGISWRWNINPWFSIGYEEENVDILLYDNCTNNTQKFIRGWPLGRAYYQKTKFVNSTFFQGTILDEIAVHFNPENLKRSIFRNEDIIMAMNGFKNKLSETSNFVNKDSWSWELESILRECKDNLIKKENEEEEYDYD
jgi:hypothetical protein